MDLFIFLVNLEDEKDDYISEIKVQNEDLKKQVRENYETEKGREAKKRRGYDVETPFGDIKHNQEYRRFRLRGLDKVKIEWGILSMGHNLRKVALRRTES